MHLARNKATYQYYILDSNGVPKLEENIVTLFKWRNQYVKDYCFKISLGDYTISTCFKGIKDSTEKDPCIWTTTIYGPNDYSYILGSSDTLAKARRMHNMGIFLAKNFIDNTITETVVENAQL